MGMGVATGGSGGSRRRRRARPRAMSEINVTPFVDVMLVLLIIFMVAAPLLVVGVPIDLPETSANALESEEEPITVSVTADGRVFLQETETSLEQLLSTLEAIANEGVDTRIFVRGDRGYRLWHDHAGYGAHFRRWLPALGACDGRRGRVLGRRFSAH
jgi:biopolymer transport protein TolR